MESTPNVVHLIINRLHLSAIDAPQLKTAISYLSGTPLYMSYYAIPLFSGSCIVSDLNAHTTGNNRGLIYATENQSRIA